MADALSGKNLLVTGGGSGIGRATTLAAADAGARVVVMDRDADGAAATVAAVNAAGGEAAAVRGDVSAAKDVEAAVLHVLSSYGRLHGAFNNAGVEGVSARTAEYDEADFDRVVAVNLKGVFLCMRHEIPAMVAAGGGAIVNMASVAGLSGFYGASAYAASKHGVIGLTRTAALEYATKGVRVNAVCPATIRTPMVERFTENDPTVLDRVTRAIPQRRLGTAEEVAAAVVWLLSDAAGFVNGAALPVDGGFLAQ